MTRLHAFIALSAIAAGLWIALSGSADAASAGNTTSTTVTCPAFNVAFADGGSGAQAVSCANGFEAVRMEMVGLDAGVTPAGISYICGTTGCQGNNFRMVGFARCATCPMGISYSFGGQRNTVKCVSGTADASTMFAVQCAR